MTTRVRRRRPRVPPRKGRQPLPQFGAGFAWSEDMKLSALNSFLKLSGEKQIGGRLTSRQMKTLMRATDSRRLGIFLKTGQRGEGIFSRLASKLAGRMAAEAAGKISKAAAKRAAKKLAAKMTKAAAKQVAKKWPKRRPWEPWRLVLVGGRRKSWINYKKGGCDMWTSNTS